MAEEEKGMDTTKLYGLGSVASGIILFAVLYKFVPGFMSTFKIFILGGLGITAICLVLFGILLVAFS